MLICNWGDHKMEEVNEEVQKKMVKLKKLKKPSYLEVRKYIRYLINVKKYSPEEVIEEVMHWPLSFVERAIKEVERENLKPKPKRYYVSLKEPLEDSSLR